MKTPKKIRQLIRLRKNIKRAKTGRNLFVIVNGTRKLITKNPLKVREK